MPRAHARAILIVGISIRTDNNSCNKVTTILVILINMVIIDTDNDNIHINVTNSRPPSPGWKEQIAASDFGRRG